MLEKEITLTFKEDVNGWTSFKTYIPDWGVSLNNRYYTMAKGAIWEHNIETYNSFSELPLNTTILAKYDGYRGVTREHVFEVEEGAYGIKFYINDNLRIELYNEETKEIHSGVYATVPRVFNDNDRTMEIVIPDVAAGRQFNSQGINFPEDSDGNFTPEEDATFRILKVERINRNNVERNTFYEEGLQDSIVEFIINTDPSTIKQFKTLGYEGIGLWDFDVYTDVESTIIDEDDIPKVYDSRTLAGVIKKTDLKEKEGKFFSNIAGFDRSANVDHIDLSSVSVQGIGIGSHLGGINSNQLEMEVDVEKDVQVGYTLYYFPNTALDGEADNFTQQLHRIGDITSIDGNVISYERANSYIRPTRRAFILYAKNEAIEKSGVVGSYAHVRMTNDDKEHAEVFSVSGQVVQSSR